MRLAFHTNAWGGVVGHPAGVTSVKDQFYLTPGSTEEALREIAAAGYAGFELFDGNLVYYAERERELRGLMEELNLELVGVYSGANFVFPDILDEELDKIRRAAELAARFEATHFVLGGGAVRAGGTRDEDYRLLAHGLDRAAAIASDLGLTSSFHPHLGTCAQTPEQIARVFEHTAIGFCPDTAHLDAAGGNSAELIRTYGDRMPYVHLKDYAAGAFLPLGEGDLDWNGILGSLRTIGYDGWITVEQDGYEGPKREAARASRAFLEGRL
ncbi:MAG: TIM barrel protein [Chloroflexia bacterium]|nr:TIM barrel protein [Chloroflexia bacterium]